MTSESTPRALARRVATSLADKGRREDAVAILAAWAVSGPNDTEGQALLADALRLDPGSALAKSAFERMEGLAGAHDALDAAVAQWTEAALAAAEGQQKRAVMRAQVGFNNNVRYKGSVYHVQTEDSGIDRPHVITHLFADGGRVVKSHKRGYAEFVGRDDMVAHVRSLMKAQHLEMCMLLREAKLDEVIAGRAPGGLSVLEGMPELTVKRGAGDAPVSLRHPPASRPPRPSASQPPRAKVVRVRLRTMRSMWGGPELYEPAGDELIMGSSAEADVSLSGERFCARDEARLAWRDGKLWLIDLEGGNGVFVRVREPVEIAFGDRFLVGDQLLALEENPTPDDWPDAGPTYFYSSPRWLSSFRLVHLWEGARPGATCVARGNAAQIGRAIGDLIFSSDPLVADQHCIVEEQAGTYVLSDLGSRSGTFVRVTGEREVVHGDELAIGRTRLRVELATG